MVELPVVKHITSAGATPASEAETIAAMVPSRQVPPDTRAVELASQARRRLPDPGGGGGGDRGRLGAADEEHAAPWSCSSPQLIVHAELSALHAGSAPPRVQHMIAEPLFGCIV